MHNDWYYVGCNNLINISTHPDFPSFSDQQCSVIYYLYIFLLILGIVGTLAHSYVIFCYNYRRYGPLNSSQILVVGLSIFDLVCCLSVLVAYTVTKIMEKTPGKRYKERYELGCSGDALFWAFGQRTVYFVALLFAANRYYSVCRSKFYHHVFSCKRMKVYFIWIALIGIALYAYTVCTSCLFIDQAISVRHDIATPYKKFEVANIVLYVVVFLPILFIVLYMCLKVMLKLRADFASQQLMSHEMMEGERSFFKAMMVFMGIVVPLLVVQMAQQLVSSVNVLRGKVADEAEREMFYSVCFTSLYATLFAINPLVFAWTNDQFRSKLSAPLRPLLSRYVPRRYLASRYSTHINADDDMMSLYSLGETTATSLLTQSEPAARNYTQFSQMTIKL